MQKFNYLSIILIIMGVFMSVPAKAANTTISGIVTDAITGEPLIGANIILMKTSMGASSDMNGKFLISRVLPGNYTIRVSYIGYGEIKRQISLKDGDNLTQEFQLEPVGVEGQEIVVTGQAYGQKQAINQQLASNQISSVVSSGRIQELPDNTVAEAVGRLPGVTVLRSGGEGNEVVIRGMQPKYNQILVDGIQMSSFNPFDRSADLSMISSNMLDGIEVIKSVTADMDADVVGGTINFKLREAKSNDFGRPVIHLLTQGTYKGLANAHNKFNNYKYVGSIENRFFEDKFGVFAQFGYERKNLTSNEFGATYSISGAPFKKYLTTGLNLFNIPRDRQRYNLAFIMDYSLPEGSIKTTNFFINGKNSIQSRSEGYFINTSPTTINQHEIALTATNNSISMISNALTLDQQIPIFHMNAKFAHTYAENKMPDAWRVSFVQTSAGLSQFSNAENLNPIEVPKAANIKLDQTFLNQFISANSLAKQRAFSLQADFDANLNISDFLSALIKFGGKYRYQTRSYNFEQYDGQGLSLASGKVVDDLITAHLGFPSTLGTTIPVGYFSDANYSYGKFLDGDYTMTLPLNFGMLSSMADMLRSKIDYINANGGSIAYARNNYLSTTGNYKGNENQSAFYLMSIINIGPQITLIPGIRYQNLNTKYTSPRGIQSALSYYNYNYYDTTVVQDHGYWLPDVSLKYKPLEWFDVRLSYSNTVAYPDYVAITPRIDVGFSEINFNNFQLTPTRSTNYDLFLSFYENTIGLFTIGGFYKEINDLIFRWSFYASGSQAAPYFPPSLTHSAPSGNYRINTYVNNPYKVKNYGIELDWQTHFWYLPGPLSGLVFNVNYTHIYSKAQYPYVLQYRPTPRSAPVFIDTFYNDRLIDQPNDIINLSIGYDFKGFSARVSLINQANIFTGSDFWEPLRINTEAYSRWDVSVKQQLPWFGIQIFANINNLNKARDVTVIQGGGVPSSQQDYGLNADFGIQIKL